MSVCVSFCAQPVGATDDLIILNLVGAIDQHSSGLTDEAKGPPTGNANIVGLFGLPSIR